MNLEAGSSGAFTDVNNEDAQHGMDVDYNEIINDSSFMQTVLDNLPGVDQVTAIDETEKATKKALDKTDKPNNGGQSGKK